MKKGSSKSYNPKWMASVKTVNDIKDVQLLQAYNLDAGRCKGGHRGTLRQNPLCAHNIGEKGWISGSKLNTAIKTLDEHSREQTRNDGHLVGLHNLGATCYVNSLLQIWYHNPRLRKLVLAYRPPESSTSSKENSASKAILELQQLFVSLSLTRRRWIDPRSLIQTLKLAPNVQQDAQEFRKLFSATLEKEISRDISSEYHGSYAYNTICKNCNFTSENPHSFVELDLQTKGYSTLEQCLEDFTTFELLDGANKYHCSNCDAKHDASRGIVLKQMPDTLVIALMRFVFDMQTLQRKKLNHAISFPEELDLSHITCNNDDIYQLQALLLHRGNTATSGHYITQARVPEGGDWVTFDDEDATPLKASSSLGVMKSVYDDSNENGQETKSKKGKKAASTSDNSDDEQEGRHKSSSVYLLVYRRKSLIHQPSNKSQSNAQQLEEEVRSMAPSSMISDVEDDNRQFRQNVKAQMTELAEHRKRLEDINTALQPLAKCCELAEEPDFETMEWIPTSWLQNVFRVQLPTILLNDATTPDEEKKDNDVMMICESDTTNGKKAENNVTDDDDVIMDDVTAMSGGKGSNGIDDDDDDVIMDETKTTTVKPLSTKKDEEVPMCYLPCLDLTPFLCSHRKLDPALVEKMKLISKSPIEKALKRTISLQNKSEIPLLVAKGPRLHAIQSMCIDCLKSYYINRSQQKQLEQDQKIIAKSTRASRSVASTDVPGVWISKKALQKFAKLKVSELESDGKASSRVNFNNQALCSHGQRILDQKQLRFIPIPLWQIMEKYFHKTTQVQSDSEPCAICQQQSFEKTEQIQQQKQAAMEEKNALLDLFRRTKRPNLQQLLLSFSQSSHSSDFGEPVSELYILPGHFTVMWRQYIKTCKTQRPVNIDTNVLLCKHGQFLFDMTKDMDPEGRWPIGKPSKPDAPRDEAIGFELQYKHQWETVRKYYDISGPEIIVTNVDGMLMSTPPCCQECREARIESEFAEETVIRYSNSFIYVDKVETKPEPPQSKSQDSDVEVVSRPRRLKRRKTQGCKRIKVNSTTTIMALKVQLLDHFHAMPIDQHLYSEQGVELVDGDRTLADYQIHANDVLHLYTDVATTMPNEDSQEAAEVGFKGSALLSSTRSPVKRKAKEMGDELSTQPKVNLPKSPQQVLKELDISVVQRSPPEEDRSPTLGLPPAVQARTLKQRKLDKNDPTIID